MPPEEYIRDCRRIERLFNLVRDNCFPCPVCGFKPEYVKTDWRSKQRIECTNKGCKAYGFMKVEGDNIENMICEWNDKIDCEKVHVEIDGRKMFIRSCYDCPFHTKTVAGPFDCSYPWKPKSSGRVCISARIPDSCPLKDEARDTYDRELDGLA